MHSVRRQGPDDGDTFTARFPDIVAQIRAGNAHAFESLYLAYFNELWRFAYRFVRAADVADDVVQDVFVSLWERRDAWTIHTTVRGYLYGSVRKQVLQRQRRETLVSRIAGIAVAVNRPLGSGDGPNSPDTDVTAEDMARALGKAVHALPERQRMAFALRWKELSVAEIAEAMGVTVVAVRKLLTKALRTLNESVT